MAVFLYGEENKYKEVKRDSHQVFMDRHDSIIGPLVSEKEFKRLLAILEAPFKYGEFEHLETFALFNHVGLSV
jgi:hypothetical protein